MSESKTPSELALEFIANPDDHAQVKVLLCALGWTQLAGMIDEAVTVSREMLRLETELAVKTVALEAADLRIAELQDEKDNLPRANDLIAKLAVRIAELERQLAGAQKAMLERRAKVCELEGAQGNSDKHYACHDCADAIRALPIEE